MIELHNTAGTTVPHPSKPRTLHAMDTKRSEDTNREASVAFRGMPRPFRYTQKLSQHLAGVLVEVREDAEPAENGPHTVLLPHVVGARPETLLAADERRQILPWGAGVVPRDLSLNIPWYPIPLRGNPRNLSRQVHALAHHRHGVYAEK